jgi:SAM-dependent methyltransferase
MSEQDGKTPMSNKEQIPTFDKGERYDSTRVAWENIWTDSDIDAELEAVNSKRSMATIERYARYLSKDDVLLEAGSGLSAVVIKLREMGYNVVGLDYAENAVKASLSYDASLPLLVGDVHQLPYAENSLGAYLSFGVLEHFEHGMMPALHEAYRVLKPGGILVLTIPYPNVVWRLAQWKRELQGRTLIDEEFFESTHNRRQLVQYVTDAGFKLEEATPTSHSFTLWGLGGMFREEGYYRTNGLAEGLGGFLGKVLPWAFNYMTLIVARK